ncbi:alpha-mannosidase [Streptomyces sp. NPDC004134]|uniref:alpha-mannosidase n=1 Tax=Streptomyces sp. NPDC004134 TaxID=3364691 RepID=UPI00369948BB
MHDDRLLAEGRLDRALRQFIRPAQYTERVPLELSVWHRPGEPVPADEALKIPPEEYAPFTVGTAWGPPWSTSWFRLTGTVPAGWAGRRVEAVIDPGFGTEMPGFQAEGLVYDADGAPVKGVHPRNRHVPIASPAAGGEPVRLLLEAAANPAVLQDFTPTLLGELRTAGDAPLYTFRSADLAVLDENVWHLILDIEVLSELMHELPVDRGRRHDILHTLDRMLDVLDLHDVPGTAAAAREVLAPALAQPAAASAHRAYATGHAHIDSAWLWPLRETVRKASRTFANVTELALSGDYPELVFACSQAQQYAWVKQHQPQIYERIRAAVQTGQFVPVGSMWVESDANMPGGEALARQLIHGKRFFAEEFGVDTQEVWLPDSFGYTAAFPQLAHLAGIRWFLTQKLSWNQTNKMPHHTFWWEGIDGTRVFTHFPPVDTYNATMHAAELSLAERNFADKGRASMSLVPFGYGDGGGGPTREMLEKARRLRSLEGSPRVEVANPAVFFAAAEEEYGAAAPVWSGELYLEFHRGTYTSQADTKSGNRRSEHLLREAELWATAAALADPAYAYPYEELDRIWKTVLLHQFHDILPGSSIAWVHREAAQTYAAVAEELAGIIAAAVAALGAADGDGFAVLNASPYDRGEVVELAAGEATALPPEAVAQPLGDGRSLALVNAPALGAGTAGAAAGAEVSAVQDGAQVVLDNGLLRVVVDGDGLLTSVRDLTAGREVLAPGARANLLQLHPDHPNQWDAWDIDKFYRRTRTDLVDAESVEVTESGPLRAAVRVVRTTGRSRIVQDISLAADSGRVDFTTEVDWREEEKVLKAAFPLDVHADRSTSEIQFGHVHRPTHANTSWDAAKFEICAHRWLHVGEPGYGVAVLNDATYGHDVTREAHEAGLGTTVRLTILRAPKFPDPETDLGVHRYRYALLPGADVGAAVEQGLALNLPLRTARKAARAPLVSVTDPAITVESVKPAEDRSGDVVVRVYESRGGRASGTLTTSFAVGDVQVTDLLERPLDSSDAAREEGGGVSLRLRPFQILTLRMRPVR